MYIGFHSVSTKNLMDHLMERYRKTRSSDLEACRQSLVAHIEVDCRIDVYFQRVEDAIQFALNGKTPFTLAQILQTEYHGVKKTGLNSLALKEWHKKLMA